ncbi:hypothetical protein ONZ45_g9497 [Pleurotus djamor]|nr:hypothetical protein ONZ45_g9497 [Pleurotus djamor]
MFLLDCDILFVVLDLVSSPRQDLDHGSRITSLLDRATNHLHPLASSWLQYPFLFDCSTGLNLPQATLLFPFHMLMLGSRFLGYGHRAVMGSYFCVRREDAGFIYEGS